MENELSNNITNIGEHSTSNNNCQTNIHTQQDQCEIPTLDFGLNQNQQTLLSGHSTNIISDHTYDDAFNRIENQLDQIDISDSEDEEIKEINRQAKLTDLEYDEQMKKVSALYDEDGVEVGHYVPTKNEMTEFTDFPQPAILNQNSKLEKLGKVVSVVENNILIEKNPNLNLILNLDTTIYSKDCEVVGFIFDVIGNIDLPYYLVMPYSSKNDENSNNELKFKNISKIMEEEDMYFDINVDNVVNKNKLINQKGTDASNAFDEEIGNNDKEFSDDEEEREYKKSKKMSKLKVEKNYVNEN